MNTVTDQGHTYAAAIVTVMYREQYSLTNPIPLQFCIHNFLLFFKKGCHHKSCKYSIQRSQITTFLMDVSAKANVMILVVTRTRLSDISFKVANYEATCICQKEKQNMEKCPNNKKAKCQGVRLRKKNVKELLE